VKDPFYKITKGQEEYNNDEINAVERLAAHENFDTSFENMHAALSKRDSIRTSLSSNRSSATPTPSGRNSFASIASKEEEKGETRERLRRHSDRKSVRSTRRSLELESEIPLKQQPKRTRRPSTSSKDDSDSKNPSLNGEHSHRRPSSSSMDDCDSKNSSTNGARPRRRTSRRHRSRTKSSDAGRTQPVRSASAIEKLLEYNEAGNYAKTSHQSNHENKSSINPLLVGLSKSRHNKTEGTGGKSTNSREKRHASTGRASTKTSTTGTRRGVRRGKSSSSASASSNLKPKKRTEDAQLDPRQRLRRRRSSADKFLSSDDRKSSSQKSGGERSNGLSRCSKTSKSLRTTRSYMTQHEPQHEPQQKEAIIQDTFEKLWGNKITSDDLNQTNNSRQSNSSSGTDVGRGSASSKDLAFLKLGPGSPGASSQTGSQGKIKKTKLEKIHELQGKCDRYKTESMAMAEELRKYLSDLNESRGETASLKKNIDVYEEQAKKLKSKFAEVRDELETMTTEQRKERTELSEAAKDLARVNIDYAKSVDAARTVKEELDGLRGILAEREEKISVFKKDLETSNDNVRQLEADVLYADEQIDKLEAEIQRMEKEVALYSEAADRDSLHDSSGNSDGANLREAKLEAEKQKCEEREEEITKKSRILEEKILVLNDQMKELEIERTRHLEEQHQKEREFEDKRAREEENLKISDENRLNEEEKANKLLNALGDENAALKGRLKSEQLDSTMKFQIKDNSIAELQTEVTRFTKEQKERESAPDSSPALLLEIETLKTEAAKHKADFEDVRMNKVELTNEVEGLHHINIEITTRLGNLEVEIGVQKKEVENQRRKTLEWQKKTGEWSEKAVTWKKKSEHWEKKAKESNNDTASYTSDDAAQVEPQALFLAAAVEKKASNVSAANVNGSWRLGRRMFGIAASDSEDETLVLMSKLEGENSLKKIEIKTLKSEMVKMQTNYKEQAYSKTQEIEKLQKEMEAIELKNANLLEELELARKLNQTISESDI